MVNIKHPKWVEEFGYFLNAILLFGYDQRSTTGIKIALF